MATYPNVVGGDFIDATLENDQMRAGLNSTVFGNRTSTKATAGAAVEIGYLRLDSVPLVAGYLYEVYAFNLRWDSTVATDHCRFNIRYSSTGAATTASTVFARSEGDPDLQSMPELKTLYSPSSTESGSFLLSFLRTSGTGTVTIQADDRGVWLVVKCIGTSGAGDVGVDV
jgi:hypothetical protein